MVLTTISVPALSFIFKIHFKIYFVVFIQMLSIGMLYNFNEKELSRNT